MTRPPKDLAVEHSAAPARMPAAHSPRGAGGQPGSVPPAEPGTTLPASSRPRAEDAGSSSAGAVTSGRPSRAPAEHHPLAAAMSEAELEEHVRTICKDLGVIRIHVYNSRGTTPGVPDDVLIGPRGILWRELKTMKGKVTPAQQAMGQALQFTGQDWKVWRPDDYLEGRIARELVAISRFGAAA